MMHKRVQALIDQAQAMSFAVDGNDGRGHIRLVHESGEVYRIASTPGDYRGDLNALADMRRIAGVSNDGPSHRRSRKAFRPSGYNPRQTRKEQDAAAQAEQLTGEWEVLVRRFIRINNTTRWTQALREEALTVVYRLRDVEASLEWLHQPIPRPEVPATWRTKV